MFMFSSVRLAITAFYFFEGNSREKKERETDHGLHFQTKSKLKEKSIKTSLCTKIGKLRNRAKRSADKTVFRNEKWPSAIEQFRIKNSAVNREC